ncbi:hypothetical protein MRX96_005944 [Rhipicephalus microplus]
MRDVSSVSTSQLDLMFGRVLLVLRRQRSGATSRAPPSPTTAPSSRRWRPNAHQGHVEIGSVTRPLVGTLSPTRRSRSLATYSWPL